ADDEEKRRQENRDEADRRPDPAVRRRPHHRAEIGGEGEQRSRHGLRGAVAGEKGVVADPPRRNHRRLQHRQHDASAAEHQRPGAIERVEFPERLRGDAAASSGRPMSSAKNATSSSAPSARLTSSGKAAGAIASPPRRKSAPTMPPSTIAPICPHDDGAPSAMMAATTASGAPARARASVRSMPSTAWATTATAATLRPCSQPEPPASPSAPMP